MDNRQWYQRGRRPESEPPSANNCLAFKYKVVDPILLPALFIVLSAERFLLSVTDGLNALCGDSVLQEHLLYRLCAAGSEGDVVFLGSTVVTMAFNEDLDVGMLREESCVILDS